MFLVHQESVKYHTTAFNHFLKLEFLMSSLSTDILMHNNNSQKSVSWKGVPQKEWGNFDFHYINMLNCLRYIQTSSSDTIHDVTRNVSKNNLQSLEVKIVIISSIILDAVFSTIWQAPLSVWYFIYIFIQKS